MNPVLYSVYLVILFIAIVAGVFNRKSLPQYFYLFIILLSVTFVVESTAFCMLIYSNRSTQPLYHFFLPFTYTMLAVIYAKTYRRKTASRILYYSIPVFLVIHLVLSLT